MTTQAPRDPANPEPPTTTTRSPRQSSLATLKNYKDFRLVWAGNFIALGGQWIQMFSIGWLVLLLTDGNAILTGTVIAIRALPTLIIGPWAGVLADRIDRLADGSLCIIDYKTGVVPNEGELQRGEAPQLPLEAAIALAKSRIESGNPLQESCHAG